jgi:hypothetical protein
MNVRCYGSCRSTDCHASPGPGLGLGLEELRSTTGLQDDEEEEKAYRQGLCAGEHHIGWLKAVFYVSLVWAGLGCLRVLTIDLGPGRASGNCRI